MFRGDVTQALSFNFELGISDAVWAKNQIFLFLSEVRSSS